MIERKLVICVEYGLSLHSFAKMYLAVDNQSNKLLSAAQKQKLHLHMIPENGRQAFQISFRPGMKANFLHKIETCQKFAPILCKVGETV